MTAALGDALSRISDQVSDVDLEAISSDAQEAEDDLEWALAANTVDDLISSLQNVRFALDDVTTGMSETEIELEGLKATIDAAYRVAERQCSQAG